MKPFQPKPRHCEVCETLYTPQRMGQKVCGAACAVKNAKAYRKEQVLRARVERAQTKKRIKELAPLRVFLAEAQAAFNAWIRARDSELPCISCGELNPPVMGPGGAWDAGHFLGRGAHPEKRFMEDNVHRQCKSCNGGSAKNPAKAMTVSQRYAIELERRIGPERYAKVLEPLPVKKWTREELTAIRDEYRKKLKEVKA